MKKIVMFLLKYLIILIGTAVGAVGINMFLVPYHIAPGGITGLGTILYYLINQIIPLGIIILIINIPIFIWGLIVLGKRAIVNILFATITFSIFIDLSENYLIDIAKKHIDSGGQTDLLLFALFGGAIMGVGLGVVYRYNTNTGGVDLLADILRKKGVHFSMGQIMFIFDAIIVIIAASVFSNIMLGMYAIIAILVFSKVVDLILEGVDFAKGLYIISEKSQEIAKKILQDMDRGVTGIKSIGKYTDTEREMLFCVIRAKQLTQIKILIKEVDPDAFVVLTDVREVLGEGFQGFDITKS